MQTLNRLGSIVACAAVFACTSDMTGPIAPVVAHGVVMSVVVPGSCVATCDPIPNGPTHLGLVTLRNTGTGTAYLQNCGSSVQLSEQVFEGGQWVNVGPAAQCAISPTVATVLAPGDSIRVNWWFDTGRRRVLGSVAAAAAGASFDLDASGSFDVR
jgi:hypothetical protein